MLLLLTERVEFVRPFCAAHKLNLQLATCDYDSVNSFATPTGGHRTSYGWHNKRVAAFVVAGRCDAARPKPRPERTRRVCLSIVCACVSVTWLGLARCCAWSID